MRVGRKVSLGERVRMEAEGMALPLCPAFGSQGPTFVVSFWPLLRRVTGVVKSFPEREKFTC